MLLIFDWDGTLCNSTDKIAHCLSLAAAEVGLPILSEQEYKNIIGLGLPEAVHALYPESNPAEQEALRLSYSKFFLEKDQTPSPFYEGVEETLSQLRDDGHKLAIATGKSRRGLDRILKQRDLDGFFHATRCADETASKPNPLMLNELLEQLVFTVEQAVFVGDTEFDMEMAQKISMPRVAVSYGAHHMDRLKKYDPALCIDYFPDFAEFIKLAN